MRELRTARSARIVTSELPSPSMLSQPCLSSSSEDLVVCSPSTRVVVLPDVAATLEMAAADVEARMTIVCESARLDASASVYSLAQLLLEECHAAGLAPRHGTRLGLEAVLSHGRDPAQVKALAAAIHQEVMSHSYSGPISRILDLLEVHGIGGEALNVCSVLCFTEAITHAAFAAWRAASPAEEVAEKLKPLLQWLDRPASEEVEDTTAEESTSNRPSGNGEGSDKDGAPRSSGIWRPIACIASPWEVSAAQPALTAELGPGGDAVVVLDGLLDDTLRNGLLHHLIGEPDLPVLGPSPPTDRWDRTTCDGAGLPRTWGLKPHRLHALEGAPPACVVEVQSRLAKLYPEYAIGHMPRVAAAASGDRDSMPTLEYDATSFVANAAVWGNQFQWHVDGDPSSFPPGEWLSRHGDYRNGEAGKPLLVSLLVYLNDRWQQDWDAETLFLADDPGVGLLVQPRPGRAVLLHQDVLHRVSAPSLSARRPRYSLVWKLVFYPRESTRARETICREEWGTPARIGGCAPACGR